MHEWKTLGVVRPGGRTLPASEVPASLVEIGDRAWLVTGNYEALLAYNCSHAYAMSVVTLADRLPAR